MTPPIPDAPTDILELAKALVTLGNYRALAALLIFAVVKFGLPYIANSYPFFQTAKGKAAAVIAIALLTGLFQSLLPGNIPNVDILWNALQNALVAAVGFSLLKPFMPTPEAK